MDPILQQQLDQLSTEKRGIVDAILARSGDLVSLELALALVHVRAEEAMASMLSALERAVVYVLLRTPEDWSTSLILEDAAGHPHLGVFTSEAQAEIARQDYGKDYVSVSVDMVLLCRSLQGALGLAMNPHDEVLAFEMAPSLFAHFREALQERSAPEVGEYYSVFAGDSGYHIVHMDEIGETLTLTWNDLALPHRPAASVSDIIGEIREVSPKAFQQWLPLRLR